MELGKMNGKEASGRGSCCGLLRSAGLSLSSALVIAFSILAMPAQGQNPPGNTVFDLVPIGSTGTVTSLVGNDIVIPGGGVVVELELRVSNWGATGDGELQALQATIDGSGYCSGIGDPLNPLGYPGAPLLACPQGNGCPDDGVTCNQGGFIRRNVCVLSPNAGDICFGPADCPGGFCSSNPDYLFNGFMPIAVVGYPGLNYEYVGVNGLSGKPDAGLSEMFGTLLVEIPLGAAGTYNIDFTIDTERNFNADDQTDFFAVVNLNGATITVTTGSCCFDLGPGTTNCVQDVTQSVCDGLAQPSNFRQGAECGPPGTDHNGPDFGNGPYCTGCTADSTCNDDNSCTTDICSIVTGGCINTNNFDDVTDCCNPIHGGLTPITDFEICTDDTCNAQTGNVSHTAISNCAGCMTDVDCFDGNACTDDICDVNSGDCNRTPNFNEAVRCCDPSTGSLSSIDDSDECTDDTCDAKSGQVNHSPIAGCVSDCKSIAAAMAGDCPQNIPTVSEWGLVVLSLLLLIGGKLYFGRREANA